MGALGRGPRPVLPACCRLRREGSQLGGAQSLFRAPVYAGVAEVSVYVENDARGLGVGSALLSKLIAASEREGFWTLQAGIFPENEASLALHKKHGFRVVGRRERIGQMKDGTWRDVLLLERRSGTVGL